MFGVSIWELALCIIVAFVVLGPQRLAEIAYHIGHFLRVLRKNWAHFNQEDFAQYKQSELEKNQAKAAEADRHYQTPRQKTPSTPHE